MSGLTTKLVALGVARPRLTVTLSALLAVVAATVIAAPAAAATVVAATVVAAPVVAAAAAARGTTESAAHAVALRRFVLPHKAVNSLMELDVNRIEIELLAVVARL